jgi:uncharacterized integral membrane protein
MYYIKDGKKMVESYNGPSVKSSDPHRTMSRGIKNSHIYLYLIFGILAVIVIFMLIHKNRTR